MNYSADMLNSTRKTDHVIVYQIKMPTQGGNDEKPEKQCRQKKKNIHTDRIAGRYSDHSYTATLKMAFFLLFSAVFAFSFFDEKTLNTQIPNVTFRMIF